MTFKQNYIWGHERPFNDFSSHFKTIFSERVQKIAVDAGFTCPNRDGSKALGGCTYCNNNTFNPFYCEPSKSVTQQLEEGIAFFAPKYKTQKYIAYFQAYSNTYSNIEKLKSLYCEALSVPGVIGLSIATRPDCVNTQILDFLQKLAVNYYISIEYGIESCNNDTLKTINRGHTFEESVYALEMSKERGIHVGVHYILGLPGDSRDDMIEHAKILSTLPFESLKLHQLQIIKNTLMAKQYSKNPAMFKLFSSHEYIDFVVSFTEYINPKIIIERFISESPAELLIAPIWGGLKNFEIVSKIEKKFIERNTYQGKLFS